VESTGQLLEDALASYEKREYAKAEKFVDALLEGNPQFHRGWFLKGVILEETGKGDVARKCYAKAGSLFNMWFRLALQLQESDPERALVYYARVLEMDRNFSMALLNKGMLHEKLGEREKAKEALKRYAADLEIANKELESFSYSASHDLRAPLRTLDGFSEILIQEYGDKLDETGKDYLNRIRKASQNMSQLIDDMAKLSRITQVGMNYQEVDLSEMARSILKEFKEYQPERKADFIIAPHMKAKADDQLTLILMRNLLENAWKFTSRCPLTKIEFGISSQRGKEVYFIKDNGIGFDMKYADKLFKPFQRIHSEKDYTGTGIGLAIVQRVVQRHGGRIWAESEVSKGATFFFTLG